MKRRADREPGYVLHTYPYKETSLIVEAFTLRYGRVALLARGARRPRSAMRGILLSFHPLRLTWSGSSELGTLIAAEWSGGWSGGQRPLAGLGLMCGFYVNELVLRLLPRDDPHEALFDFYTESLNELSAGAAQGPALRRFEKRLLAELGYAPLLEHDFAARPIDPERRYVYEPERGPREVKSAAHRDAPAEPGLGPRSEDVVVSGQTLLDVAHDEYGRPETRDEARSLMRALIGQRLHGQVLHTRAVLLALHDL
jgi:DNA repair protein RecO (recombination protein O)